MLQKVCTNDQHYDDAERVVQELRYICYAIDYVYDEVERLRLGAKEIA